MHYFKDLGMLNSNSSSSHEGGFFVSLSFLLWVHKTSSPAITWILICIVVKMDEVRLKLAYKNLNPTTTTGYSMN